MGTARRAPQRSEEQRSRSSSTMAADSPPAGEKKEEKQLKEISVEEFKKHNSPKDLWLCIHGKVLDVTNYQDDHPGSDSILQEKAGMDASQDFVDVGHTPEAKAIQEGLVIGYIPEEQLKTLEGYVEGLEEEEANGEGGGMNMLLVL